MGEDRPGRRHYNVIERRAGQSYQLLELLFWQQFSVISDLDQGTEREAFAYVVTTAAVGLLVLHQSRRLPPDLHFAGDGQSAPECWRMLQARESDVG